MYRIIMAGKYHNVSKRNFKEGERMINAGRIIYCGKNIDFNGSVRLSSKCLSTSSLKGEPHEIKG